ncbi:MAG: InlB B-repeat-containing protein, partial [Lachnospiraceae bacterium]|nr:InlB B-repeat-containing protein [Lachnospiraceae bacterium]
IQQIKSCTISGFDTGINLNYCPIVVSDCKITDCNSGVTNKTSTVAIVGTTLMGKASEENSVSVTTKGVTTSGTCFLIDSDITDFDIGSDAYDSNHMTIIGCKYENRDTNLICAFETAAYDTSFIGSETSVIIKSGSSYFYDCVVEGDAVATTGFSVETSATNLHIYSMERPYYTPYNDGYYNDVKQNSNGTVKNGKSEIFNCKTGIDAKSTVNIADTHMHHCDTGIKASSDTYSYGNNLIENCTNGMEMQSLFKNITNTTFTDIHVDTIRNCSNDGFTSSYVTSNPVEWKNRLEIYDCDNYGIKTTGTITSATVDVHDCKTGIYIANSGNNIILGTESKVYDNREWNIYDDSSATSSLIIQGSEGTLTGGAVGNIYFSNPDINHSVIVPQNLYSDDSVYYLGTADGMCLFGMNNLYGTVVIDTIDSGYIAGRRVAGLYNPNVASKMFAKKEGFVISTETVDINGISATYAVFAEGYDVTYDVTANGGDTFIDEDNDEEIKDGKPKRISYLKDDTVNLNYKASASKPGYTFVGWNTDKNATEGLETLTAEEKDITLYAIYEKTATINYHTYDAALDYSTEVTFYNNQDKIVLAPYNASGDKTFAGYVLNENAAVSSADDLLKAGDNVTVSPDGLDVYCVYEKQGQLTYLKKDGTTLSTEGKTVYEVCSDNKEFVYTVRAGEPVEGFTFTGWE